MPKGTVKINKVTNATDFKWTFFCVNNFYIFVRRLQEVNLTEYFPYEKVLENMFTFCETMLGIKIQVTK